MFLSAIPFDEFSETMEKQKSQDIKKYHNKDQFVFFIFRMNTNFTGNRIDLGIV